MSNITPKYSTIIKFIPAQIHTRTILPKMHFKHHGTTTASNIVTTTIILIVFFVFIAILIAAYLIANWRVDRSMQLHERTIHQDVEAGQFMFAEENHNDYNTFPSYSHGACVQDRESRRTQRRERMRDHISEIYQIAMSRLDEEVSVSSDDSKSTREVGGSTYGQAQVRREEEESDSSESESDSSDDSYSDSDEIEEMRGLSSMVRPLPQRVDLLRVDMRRVTDCG